MEYKILEENMDRLEKKLNRIAAKCKKYGNEFVYENKEYIYVVIACRHEPASNGAAGHRGLCGI